MAEGAARYITQINGLLRSRTGIVMATVLITLVVRLAGTIMLSRLLNAEAYGVVGIVTAITIIIAMLSDIGIAAFAIRHNEGDDRTFLDEIWTIRLVRSITLTFILIALAVPLAHFVDKPQLALAIACGSLTFLFDGVSSLVNVTAPRSQQITMLSVLDVACSLFQLVVSVAFAFWFRNYWALIAAILLTQALRAILSYLLFKGSGRRWRWSLPRAREIMIFSRHITGSTVLSLLISQSDKIVMGKLFNLEGFGVYMLAGNLASTFGPLALLYQQRVAFPKFAAMNRERPEDLSWGFYEVRRWQTIGYMFMVGGFAGSAHLVVKALYDPRYIGAAPILALLAIAPLFLLNNLAINDVMIARGKSSFTFWTNVVRVAWLAIVGTGAYLAGGVTGVVAAIGFVEIPALFYGWYRLGRIGFLNWRIEMQFLAAAAIGYGLGACGSALLYPLIK